MTHSSFNPSLAPAQRLEAILIGRHAQADRLTEQLWESSRETAGKPAILLRGQRGIGKSHLVSMVTHRLVERNKECNRLAIAWLSEDPWLIQTFFDLLAAILRQLTDVTAEQELRAAVKQSLRDPGAIEAEAWRRLEERIEGRTLLLVVENLDTILDNFGEDGQRRWRALMQETGGWAILASTPALSQASNAHDAPFFAFFNIEDLQNASADQAVELFQRLAETDALAKSNFRASLYTPLTRSRIRAVHSMAGGNYRILVTVYELLKAEEPGAVTEAFLKSVDAFTPYYQAQMQALAPQKRKVMAFLCDRGVPTNVNTIAEQCSLSPQAAAAQLKELREARLVFSYERGRESLYQVTEPFMRICLDAKRHQAAPLQVLVDVLAVWYHSEELRGQLAATPGSDHAWVHLAAAVVAKAVAQTAPLPMETLERIERLISNRSQLTDAEQQEAGDLIELVVPDERWDVVGRLALNPELCQRAWGLVSDIQLDSLRDASLSALRSQLAYGLNNLEDAISCARRAYDLDPESAWSCVVVRRLHVDKGIFSDIAIAAKTPLYCLAQMDEPAFLTLVEKNAGSDPDLMLDLYVARYPNRAGGNPILFTQLASRTDRMSLIWELPGQEQQAIHAAWILHDAFKSKDGFTFVLDRWRNAPDDNARIVIAIALAMASLAKDAMNAEEKDRLLQLYDEILPHPAIVALPEIAKFPAYVADKLTRADLLLSLPVEARAPMEQAFRQIDANVKKPTPKRALAG